MKRIGHIIGIGLIVLMMIFIFWTQATEENVLEVSTALLSIILFLTFGFLRLYNYFRLEKIRKLTDKKDFVDYFDSLTFVKLLPHVVIPFPVLQPANTNQERKIIRGLNVSTGLLWIFFVIGMFFFPSMN